MQLGEWGFLRGVGGKEYDQNGLYETFVKLGEKSGDSNTHVLYKCTKLSNNKVNLES